MTSAQMQPRSSGPVPLHVFMQGKTPGKVMANAEGRRILPTFKYAGAAEFIRKCVRDRKQFDRDMVELFAISGFGGEFHCSVHRPVKGNTHVKGLRLKGHSHGVLIEANYGGNADLLQISVIAPQDTRDPMRFLELLKKGQETLAEEDEEDALARRASYGRGGDVNFSPEKEAYRLKQQPVVTVVQPAPAPPAPVAVPEPAVTPPAVVTAVAQKPATSARSVPFYKDATSLHLFMEELEKHATPDGLVTRTSCLQILTREGLAQSNGAGSMLKGVIKEGHLIQQTSNEMLRFGGMWLTAWQNEHGTAEPAVPTASDGGVISIGDLANIDKLTDEAQRLRLRREALEASLEVSKPKVARIKAELQMLEPKVACMKSELGELETQTTNSQRELDLILGELRDPKYAKAQGDLALLQKLLGKKI